jgi:uncharacterized protein (DUF433 family)
MSYKGIVVRDPKILLWKPTIKGTRISVELIMKKLAGGSTFHDILNSYPHLSKEQIEAACDYAAEVISNEIIID